MSLTELRPLPILPAMETTENGSGSSNRKIILPWIMALYVLFAAAALPLYRFHIAPDIISYTGIAQKYLAGQWSQAINGYWGPLFPWLLVPFVAIGSSPLFAAKIAILLVGLLVLPALNGLAGAYNLSNRSRVFMLLSSFPALLYFGILNISPDLPLALVLLVYFNLIFRDRYLHSAWPAVGCGILGALAYFCKQYGFMFFAAHLAVFTVLLAVAQKTALLRRRAILNGLLAMTIFAVLSAGWIGLISHKYGTITLGTAGAYNQSLLNPTSTGHAYTQGLLELPNPTAACAWEDPSYFSFDPWKPFADSVSRIVYARLVADNVKKLAETFATMSLFAPALLLALLLLCIRPFRELASGKEWYPLLAMALYAGGYVLILVDLRFFSPVFFLLLLSAGIVIDRLAGAPFFQKPGRWAVLIIATSLSFMAYPAMKLTSHYHTGKKHHLLAAEIADICKEPGRMASDEQWHDSFYAAYLSGHPYLGLLRPRSSCEEKQNELRGKQVEYLLIWNPTNTACPEFETSTELNVQGFPPLWIARVR